MKRIAICGNIASGKTTVQKILEEKGYKVLDADSIAHELLTINNEVLFDAFKDYDVFEQGEFSRSKLGQLVFSDKNIQMLINSIMHPQIAAQIEMFFEQNSSEEMLFVGIPLLFEAGMQNMFDKIIFIYADDEIRLHRLLKRNKYTIEQAKARMNSQMPQEKKLELSDYIINNNGNYEDLKKQVYAMQIS